jgi:hypothetical protein
MLVGGMRWAKTQRRGATISEVVQESRSFDIPHANASPKHIPHSARQIPDPSPSQNPCSQSNGCVD